MAWKEKGNGKLLLSLKLQGVSFITKVQRNGKCEAAVFQYLCFRPFVQHWKLHGITDDRRQQTLLFWERPIILIYVFLLISFYAHGGHHETWQWAPHNQSHWFDHGLPTLDSDVHNYVTHNPRQYYQKCDKTQNWSCLQAVILHFYELCTRLNSYLSKTPNTLSPWLTHIFAPPQHAKKYGIQPAAAFKAWNIRLYQVSLSAHIPALPEFILAADGSYSAV